MSKLFSKLVKNNKVYRAFIPEHSDDSPSIEELYISDISPVDNAFEAPYYSIYTMRPTRYQGLYNNTEYKAKVEVREMDHCSVLTNYAYDLDNQWNVRYFSEEQDAIDFIIFHYEYDIKRQLNKLTKFKTQYGTASYDSLRYKTKEFKDEEETYRTYRKYEIYDYDEDTIKNRKIKKTIENVKYLVFARTVELDWYGNEKYNRYTYEKPVCMFDTLEEASEWVTKHDKSRHESECEVTRYSIKSVNSIKQN